MTTLKGMISAFISTRKLKNLSQRTIDFYTQILKKFLSFIESNYPDISLDRINHNILREYISSLRENHSPSGINHHIKVLKILFKFMVEEGVITENPSKKISKLKIGQTVIPTFTNDQIRAMLEVTKNQTDFPGLRNYTMITLLYDTGCKTRDLDKTPIRISALLLDISYLKLMVPLFI
jgi:site-specific recombinase XerD